MRAPQAAEPLRPPLARAVAPLAVQAAPPTAGGLLALQRAVGNQAVLRRLGAHVVARQKKKDEPALPDKLVGSLPEKQRKGLQEVTGIESIAVPPEDKVQNVALKPEFQAGIPFGFRAALTNVLDQLLLSWLQSANTTAAVSLDLKDHGGGPTVWRFTHLENGTDTRYLIDLVTNQPLDTTADDTRWKAHSFKLSGSDAAFKLVVQQAVARIPDAFLAQIDGVTFKRGTAAATDPDTTGGNYNANTHEVTIFDVGMKTGSSRYDDDAGYKAPLDERVREVIHEIGHAIDEVPLRQAIVKRQKARTDLESQWSSNVTFDKDGGLSWQADKMPTAELNKLKADVAKYEKANKGVDAARAETGHGVIGTTPALSTPFRKALEADGNRPLTPYVAAKRKEFEDEKDKTLKLGKQADFFTEAYAEAFSLYISEPETLRALRPNLFKFFKDKEGKLEKAAKKP